MRSTGMSVMMGKSMNWNKRSAFVVIPINLCQRVALWYVGTIEAEPSISFEVKPA